MENSENRNSYTIRNIKVKEDYVMVFLEDYRIMIPVETYYELGLRNKQKIDEETLERMKNDERVLRAYRSCLRKLAARDHTVKQIRVHLKEYELNSQETDDIISKLSKYGLLDDEKYAEGRISVYDSNDLSARQIREKLKKDGISEDLIDRYLKTDEKREYEKAGHLAERFAKSSGRRSAKAKKQYVLNRLVNAGYSYGMSRDILNEMDIGSDEDEMTLLKEEYEKLLKKYSKKYEGYELRSRLFAALMNRGFNSDDIKTVMEV